MQTILSCCACSFNYLRYYLLQHILFSINIQQGPKGRNINGSLLHRFVQILKAAQAENLSTINSTALREKTQEKKNKLAK